MKDLTDDNISKLINEQNDDHDNNNIKNWFNHIIDEPSAVNISSKSDYKCKKVDASKLQTKSASVSLKKHNNLSVNDKLIFDQAYIEEYYGIHTQSKIREYIIETEYQALRPIVGTALPTYAISIIIKDKNGKPARAKYLIVVLGNLDPHDWSKSECFVPVISEIELNLMMSLACQLKIEPKKGDFLQAFRQSTLPTHKQYICKPPLGCPVTPPIYLSPASKNIVWLETLVKTLV